MISTRLARTLLAVVLLAVAAGCWRPGSRIRNPFERSAARSDLAVVVENQNFNDATVFAYRGGERVRMGTVTGKSDAQYTLSWDFSLDLEFRVELLGDDRGCRTRPMPVNPGESVRLRIPTNIGMTPCQAWK